MATIVLILHATRPAPEPISPSRLVQYASEDGKKLTLPSARAALERQPLSPPIYRLSPNLTMSPNTIVSAYFRVSSKHTAAHYDIWMDNFLGLQDHMVIFTSEDMLGKIELTRAHALDRTVVIIMELEDVPLASLYNISFWEDQMERDAEKDLHKSYKLFWIWLSKTYWVHEAVRMNFFNSDIFMWCDFGSFRQFSWPYHGKTLIRHHEMVPVDKVLQMAFNHPTPLPGGKLLDDKFKYSDNFYHSGMHSIAYAHTWKRFYPFFLDTIDKFLELGIVLCDDQVVLQGCCTLHPELCAYVLPEEAPHDRRFRALRYVLHFGGSYNYWTPPNISDHPLIN